jgi:hypothetical protein
MARAITLLERPLVSGDRSLVVVPVVDADGTRGYENFSVWFFDTGSGTQRASLTLLSVDESAEASNSVELGMQVCERVAELEKLLRVARVEPLLPILPSGSPQPSHQVAGCSVVADVLPHASKRVVVRLAVNGRSVLKHALASEVNEGCPARFFSAEVWASLELDVVLMVASYSTLPNACPTYYDFVLSTVPRAVVQRACPSPR